MGATAVSRDRNEPQAWLDEVGRLRARTRKARRGYWFPLLLFGVLVLAATPLYVQPTGRSGGGFISGPNYLPGGYFTANPRAVELYWLIGMPVAYLISAGFYWLRARRRGVGTSTRTFALAGLGLLGLLVLTAVLRIFLPGDLSIRGLMPLIVIGLGFVVLARAERSIGLLLFTAPFVALTIVANLYNIENVTGRMSWGAGGPEVNVVVVGAVLLLGGLGFAIASGIRALRNRRRR